MQFRRRYLQGRQGGIKGGLKRKGIQGCDWVCIVNGNRHGHGQGDVGVNMDVWLWI